MADKKISELTTITTVDNAADLFPIVDSSAAETKKITPSALKTALALNNVDNTTDANKPVSSATQTALDAKQDSLGFTAENVANKSTTLDTDKLSNTKYPSVKSVYDWAVGLFLSKNTAITGATKTKITYDANGLVTAGSDLSATDIPTGVDAAKIGSGVVSNTEFSYLDGVTSAIQTQIDSKQASLGFTAENVSNKSTSVSTDQASNTKYPSVKSVYDWATGLFATITNLGLKTDKLVVANRQTASYTLVLSDADKLIEMNVASANNLTIPLNSSVAFSVGTQIILAQYGAGQTTIVPTSGVTLRSNGSKTKLNVQYSGATLIKIATDEWYLFGDIA